MHNSELMYWTPIMDVVKYSKPNISSSDVAFL